MMKRACVAGLLMLAGACSAVDAADTGEPWLPAPAELGKGDGLGLLLAGSEIPSAFVDDTAFYLRTRRINHLVQVGALEGAMRSVAERADGIIAALPADGRISPEELVRLEDPNFFVSLFPEEQDALPLLWPLLEMPDEVIDVRAIAPAGYEEAEDLSEAPGPATIPELLPLDGFPAGQHPALQRLQLVHNHDADPSTIAWVDLTAGLENPAPFLPSEVSSFEAARREFLRLAVSPAEAIVTVDRPGLVIEQLDTGPVTWTATRELVYEQVRTWTPSGNSARFTASLDARLRRSVYPEIPDGHRLLILGANNEERFVAAPSVGLPFPNQASTLIESMNVPVEIWEGSTRVFAAVLQLPRIGNLVPTNRDLHRFMHHAWETHEGVPLVLNVRETSMSGTTARARFTYDVEPIDPESPPLAGVLAQTVFQEVQFPAGEYLVPNGSSSFVLEIYPEGAVRYRSSPTAPGAWMVAGRFNEFVQTTMLARAQSTGQLQFRGTGHLSRLPPSTATWLLRLEHLVLAD